MMSAPTMVMPLTALAPDMSGVWSVGGTRPISSTPRNVASVKMTIAMIERFGGHASAPYLAGVHDAHRAGDLVVQVDDELAVLDQVLQQRQHIPAEHLARMQRHRRGQVERARMMHAVRRGDVVAGPA